MKEFTRKLTEKAQTQITATETVDWDAERTIDRIFEGRIMTHIVVGHTNMSGAIYVFTITDELMNTDGFIFNIDNADLVIGNVGWWKYQFQENRDDDDDFFADDDDDYEYDDDPDYDNWDDFSNAIAQADLQDIALELALDYAPTVNTCHGCGDDISGLVNCPRCGLVADIVEEIVTYIRSFADYGLAYSYASECIVIHNGDRGTMQIYIHPDDGALVMEAWHWADNKSWDGGGVSMGLLYREFKHQMSVTKKVGGK